MLYTVTFNSDIQTKELSIDNGTVVFDLAGNEYFVLSDLLANFALDIGIGENQSGNLTILNGTLKALTTDRGTRIGGDNGGVGSLTINNQGAFLTNELDVVRGSVTILNGSITAESSFGTFGEEGSPVIFLVDGANSVLQFDGGAFGCDYCTSPPSDTLLTVANGGTVNGNFMRIVDDVVLSGTTSTLNVQHVFISGNIAGPGNLSGNGSITGNLQNVSGIVSPGLSVGNLTIDGNYQQETNAVLNLEIGGTTPTLYDQLIVSGNVNLFSGTTFELNFVDGFSPTIGDQFTDLITFGNGFTGDVNNLQVIIDLPANLSYEKVLDGDSFGITILSQSNTIIGTEGNDRLNGTSGDDTLIGLGGNDRLDGKAGTDTMIGGLGNDTYTVDNAGDAVTENVNEGTDTVHASITYTLPNNIESLLLTGSSNLNGTGNALKNKLTGNGGNNILTGLDGNDTLDGKAGADTMIGGLGNDTYTVDNIGDVITENANEGTDSVKSSISYTLGANLENLTLAGSAGINGTGNALKNKLTGNSGANILNGGAGAGYRKML
jgi:Ca2+-binding RTX toxin-like protein